MIALVWYAWAFVLAFVLLSITSVTRCWTGRLWVNVGRGALAIGFGPCRLVERVFIARRCVYDAGGVR